MRTNPRQRALLTRCDAVLLGAVQRRAEALSSAASHVLPAAGKTHGPGAKSRDAVLMAAILAPSFFPTVTETASVSPCVGPARNRRSPSCRD
jgi:hypothetical protein